jgi:hypothetical protein
MTQQSFLDSLVVNWKTSLGGIMVAVPPLITAAGFILSPAWQHWLALATGLGALLIGLAAKDATTHSTVAQIEKSTSEAKVEAIKEASKQ